MAELNYDRNCLEEREKESPRTVVELNCGGNRWFLPAQFVPGYQCLPDVLAEKFCSNTESKNFPSCAVYSRELHTPADLRLLGKAHVASSFEEEEEREL